MIVSCTSDDYVGEVSPMEHPIAVGGNAGMVTRAGDNGLENFLPADNRNILFYGIKNTSQTSTPQWQDVFQNYVLSWQTNTAGTSVTNSNDWEYVGGTSVGPYNPETETTTPTTQTIKYWDYNAQSYNFFAVAPLDRANPIKGTTPADFTYTVTVDPENPTFFTRVQPVEKGQYGNAVTLLFQSLLSKVRVGVYETIPGYEITSMTFYTSLDETPSYTPAHTPAHTPDTPAYAPSYTPATTTQPVLIGINDNEFATKGTYTISYNTQNSEMNIVILPLEDNGNTLVIASNENYPFVSNPQIDVPGQVPDPVAPSGGQQVVRCETATLGDGDSHIILGRSSNNATMGFTPDGRGFIPVLSNPAVAHELSIKCDYTLQSKSAGSNDVIEIKGRTAKVPVTYGTWRPNYAYTYLFKITDDGSGLYPLSFDACVETFADNSDGTVTIVQKPSITTWQYDAVHEGDVTNPDKDVQYVLATNRSDDSHDIDVEVSTADIDGAQGVNLEVCYYGPQITEGEFEFFDKQARANSKLPSTDPNYVANFVWAPIATKSGGEITPEEFGYRRSATEVRSTTALMNSNERADSHLPEGVTTSHDPKHTYNDGTFLFGTFRPLLGGYYAIRFTYKVGGATVYAYKIVKIGEYSFLEPTIQIDDNYQDGVVIP